MDWSLASTWLPMAFFVLMGFAVFAYAVLDGYDLGVGMLMAWAGEDERDMMVASIGPFWDANETWLVLGVGLMLVAFPEAHGVVLGELYMPVAIMLCGLTLRGVAFDFRAKAGAGQKKTWDRAFMGGSMLAGFSQGVMCARFVTGFEAGWLMWMFALAVGAGVCGFYCWLGAGWLAMKCEGPLQQRAVAWGMSAMSWAAMAIVAVSVATPLASSWIWEKWFGLSRAWWLAPVPIVTAGLFWLCRSELKRLGRELGDGLERLAWTPMACAVGVATMSFVGLGYSVFPYVAVGQLTMWQAAAAPEALMMELWGAGLAIPAILAYTVFAYRVFWGKARPLDYH